VQAQPTSPRRWSLKLADRPIGRVKRVLEPSIGALVGCRSAVSVNGYESVGAVPVRDSGAGEKLFVKLACCGSWGDTELIA
jgi:hypothetical protein